MTKIKPLKPVSKVKKITKVKKVKRIKKKKPPRTADQVGSSKVEKEFFLFLLAAGIIVTDQHQIGYKFYDFIVKDTKILIEFHGSYYHCDPKVYTEGPINKMQKKNVENDKHKKMLAESLGYKIIYVWENDYYADKAKVKKTIIDKIKKYKEKGHTV